MKTIALVPVSYKELEGFTLDKLQGRKYFRVLRTVEKSDVHVVLEYDEGELADPGTDPLIIGTIHKEFYEPDGGVSDDYQPRVLWNEQLWRTLDEDTEDLFHMMTGIKG